MKVLTDPALQVATLTDWIARGGGTALSRALAAPTAIIPEIAAAGLRGMGGAGFATHVKWQAVASEQAPEKWVLCNGNEDEPGTFKDRFLLSQTPHQVIEGAVIAALATGASQVVFYVNPREQEALLHLEHAVLDWQAHPWLAQLSQTLGKALRLSVQASSGHYVGGEETGAVAAVSGGFPFPRAKPPWPAELGVNGQPTLVNNVETLALACHVLWRGADWFRGLGRGAPGTKLFSLSGDVLRPGLHELPMGTPLRVARILRRIERNEGQHGDIEALETFAQLLPGSGRCGLVDGAATVLASSLRAFRPEYERALGEHTEAGTRGRKRT